MIDKDNELWSSGHKAAHSFMKNRGFVVEPFMSEAIEAGVLDSIAHDEDGKVVFVVLHMLEPGDGLGPDSLSDEDYNKLIAKAQEMSDADKTRFPFDDVKKAINAHQATVHLVEITPLPHTNQGLLRFVMNAQPSHDSIIL